MQLLAINILKEGFFGILLTFDTIIYGLIGGAFKVFMAVAKARLLTSDTYYNVANKIYLIVGVMMLFVLSYAILRAIIDPDQATKGELGPKMIQRVVIAVVGLALTPAIFNILYQAQGLFMEKDVLAQIFFKGNSTLSVPSYSGDEGGGNGEETSVDEKIKKIGGAVTATSVWQAFFSPADGYNASDVTTNASEYFAAGTLAGIGCAAGIATSAALATGVLVIPVIGWIAAPLIMGATIYSCVTAAGELSAASSVSSATNGKDMTLEEAYAYTSSGGSFSVYIAFLHNYTDNDTKNGRVNYLFLISTICGLFILYSFLSFTIDMGIRAAKLAYLQIVAPIPLVMQVLPKYKDTFTKWYKSVFSAFAEVFIRISVVYIVVYVICHLSDVFSAVSKGFANSDLNTLEAALAYAALIMGLIAFCRKAPNIIQQTLGISGGDLKFGLGEKLKDGGVFAATAIGHGGITSAVRGFRNFDKKKWQQEHNVNGDTFNGKAGAALAQLMSGVGGLGAGMGRASWNQFGDIFGGAPKQEANNWGDALNKGEEAAQQHMDAVQKANERRSEHFKAVNAVQKTQQELQTAEAAAAAANAALAAANPADANYATLQADAQAKNKAAEDARAAYVAAQEKAWDTTALGAFDESTRKKITAWSVGSIDTSKFDTKLQLLGTIEDFRDQARATTAKDANVQAAQLIKNQVDSETVSEYDDERYARDVQTARTAAAARDYSAVPRTERQAYLDAQAEATAARAYANAHLGDAAAQTAAADAESRALTAHAEWQTAIEVAKNKAIADAVAAISKEDYRRSAEELDAAREDLRRRQQAAKDSLETAQDIAFSQFLASGDPKAVQMMQKFATDNATELQRFADDEITFEDATGTKHTVTIREMLRTEYGLDVDSASFDQDMLTLSGGKGSVRATVNDVEVSNLELPDGTPVTITDPVTGTVKSTFKFNVQYSADGKTIEHYIDVDGVFGPAGGTVSPSDFHGRVTRAKGKAEAKENKIRRIADAAKKARTAVVTSAEYIKAQNQKRQQKEAGKK